MRFAATKAQYTASIGVTLHCLYSAARRPLSAGVLVLVSRDVGRTSYSFKEAVGSRPLREHGEVDDDGSTATTSPTGSVGVSTKTENASSLHKETFAAGLVNGGGDNNSVQRQGDGLSLFPPRLFLW